MTNAERCDDGFDEARVEALIAQCGKEAEAIHGFLVKNVEPSMGALLALLHLGALSARGSVQPPMDREFFLRVCAWTYDVAEHLVVHGDTENVKPANNNAEQGA